MRVFDVYSYNLKHIRFKDNKDYFEKLLSDLGMSYTDIGFCFHSGYEDSGCQKAVDKFPGLNKYKRYYAESELYDGSLPEWQLSSVSINESGTINAHIDRKDFDLIGNVLKKVPHSINFWSMGVLLDNIKWSENSVSTPCFKPYPGNNAVIIDSKYRCYYSNSIRFIKEFDYGNKLNEVEVLCERFGDSENIVPLPDKFEKFCSCLGKPTSFGRTMVFDKAEEEKLQIANEVIKQTIDVYKYRDWFVEFKRFYPKTAQGIAREVMDSLVPIKGFSPKKVFTDIAKNYGFKYKRCLNGLYELLKTTAYGHTIKVSFMTRPLSSLLAADISIGSYNFNFTFALFDEIIADGEAMVECYAKRVFEAAEDIEKNYAEKLFEHFGKTPDWCVKY